MTGRIRVSWLASFLWASILSLIFSQVSVDASGGNASYATDAFQSWTVGVQDSLLTLLFLAANLCGLLSIAIAFSWWERSTSLLWRDFLFICVIANGLAFFVFAVLTPLVPSQELWLARDWLAVGALLAVAGLGLVLTLLPGFGRPERDLHPLRRYISIVPMPEVHQEPKSEDWVR